MNATKGLLIGMALFAAAAHADDPAALIKTKLAAAQPQLTISSVAPAEIDGFFMVQFENGGSLYASKDARYLFLGDLYQLNGADITNLSETRKQTQRQVLMSAVKPSDAVVFAPKGGTKAVVNVFTDVDCGYCQKLHHEMAEYNALGIEVHYLAYPRAGIGSDSHKKLVSAWCSDDRQRAITQLKARQAIPDRTCPNPTAAQHLLGQKVGVQGTPSIILPSGEMVPGYVPPAELARILGLTGPATAATPKQG